MGDVINFTELQSGEEVRFFGVCAEDRTVYHVYEILRILFRLGYRFVVWDVSSSATFFSYAKRVAKKTGMVIPCYFGEAVPSFAGQDFVVVYDDGGLIDKLGFMPDRFLCFYDFLGTVNEDMKHMLWMFDCPLCVVLRNFRMEDELFFDVQTFLTNFGERDMRFVALPLEDSDIHLEYLYRNYCDIGEQRHSDAYVEALAEEAAFLVGCERENVFALVKG